MAVARAIYSDLLVINFIVGATSFPTQTQVVALMIALYKDAYRIVGSVYAAYDATNEHTIIDTDECKMILIQEAEEITTAWHLSSKDIPPPSSAISPAGIYKIRSMLKRRPERLANTRVYGETWDDY